MKNIKNIFIGLLFITAAGTLILNQLGYFEEVNIVLILMGSALSILLIYNLIRFNIWQTLIFAAILYYILDEPLELPDVSFMVMALIVIFTGIGLSLIFPKRRCFFKGISSSRSLVFSSKSEYVRSDELKNENYEVVFSSLAIFLNDDSMIDDSATINLSVVFGSVEIQVPRTWRVIADNDNVFGSYDTRGNNEISYEKTLYIKSEIVFSSVNIIYV